MSAHPCPSLTEAIPTGFVVVTFWLCFGHSFHAALAVSDQKVLISGGCNARGALHDAFVFHLGE